jgi:hypothetical protein
VQWKNRPVERFFTHAEFNLLADVPPEVEWFANIVWKFPAHFPRLMFCKSGGGGVTICIRLAAGFGRPSAAYET